MDSQNILRMGVKRRRSNSSSDQNQRSLREKVIIPDDTLLEALKFLSCPQWSQKRFVSRQLNGVAECNISRLSRALIDHASMYYIDTLRYKKKGNKLKNLSSYTYTAVSFDTVMSEEQSTQWFKNRGFTLEPPEDIPAENALIGAKEWNRKFTIGGDCREPVLYYSQFNPLLNPCSWDYLAQFLKCIYHPSSYVKSVEMFAVNQNFIDSLKCNIGGNENEPRYICCESFSLNGTWSGITNTVDATNSLKWMARNVRAEVVGIPYVNRKPALVLVANFLLEASGAKQCASRNAYIHVGDERTFFDVLIEKFHSIPLVESGIPTIGFWYPSRRERPAYLSPNLIAQEVDSQGADELYMIENGQNRMRISFYWEKNRCNICIYSV